MIKNFLKIAWRNITKYRFYSSVNIIGLSTGLAFVLLISAYVWSELQVNNSLRNADRQYILQSKWKDPNEGYELATLGPLAKALRENYPNLVANYYRYDGITSNISKGDKSFREGIQVCDTTMLNMYGFSLMYGDPHTAFQEPFSVIVSAAKANKYFGKKDVVGQTITIENFSGSKHEFTITGVLNDLPRNSVTHLVDDYPNDLYISSVNLSFFGRNMDWSNTSIAGFLEVQKGITPKDLEKPIYHLIKQHTSPQVVQDMQPYLVPLKEYYLSANNGLVKKMLYALSAIALFILMMAVINFVNMSVSRSATRMREIGVRKVLGGVRKQLIMQFLTESVMLVFFATLLAMVIYLVTRDLFSDILQKQIPRFSEFPVYFIAFPLFLILIIGIAAGIYPAFVLSSLKSVESLKGKLISVKENVLLRKSLVAFQFASATIAFIGAIVISQQVNHFFSRDLGYNKDYIVCAQVPRDWTPGGERKMAAIRNRFAEMPQVSNVTLSYEIPDGNSAGGTALYKAGADSTSAIPSQLLMTDEYYAATYGIPMEAGAFYRNGALVDTFTVVINAVQAKALGWNNPADAIGKQVRFQGGGQIFSIGGVTKDFHFGSMQQAILPVTFLHVAVSNTFRFFSFNLKPGDIHGSIAALQKKWSALMPGTPFEYKFMDETLAKLYKSEIQLKKASYTATVLALIIVLLGVLGLISLGVHKRTKEIGIRKVLGSSVAGIISLFMKEFFMIILIAGIIACPVAYMIMHAWLQTYSNRISITATPFVLSVMVLGFFTGVLIVIQTISAARANPVKSLRTE